MSENYKVIAGILAVLVSLGSVFVIYKLSQGQIQPPSQAPVPGEESCIQTGAGEKMDLSEAKEIALKSECLKEGELKKESFCNESTGTWWIDLDIEKPGCAPACVVDVVTKKAEINWRCTGLIPEKRYACPENNTVDCMPLIQGEKEWFCSEEYLGWARENCPEFIIAY